MPTLSPSQSTRTGPPSRPRGRSLLAATAASALALGSLLGASTAASAAPVAPTPSYEVESTIPVPAGTIGFHDALYNPVNGSSYFLMRSSDLVVVVASDGTVTNLTVSEPNAQVIDTDGNVWVGGDGATAGRNLTRISPNLAVTGVTMPAVDDLAMNTATGDVIAITDRRDGLVSTVAPDLTVSSWNLGASSRNSHITVDPTTGNVYLATARDTAPGTAEYGVWIYSPSGTELGSIPTADMPSKGAYNPTTGRVSVPVNSTGVLVINPDLTDELLPVPTGVSSSLALTSLPDGRTVVSTGDDVPVSIIATDNTFTSYPITYSLGATMNASGAVFIGAVTDGVFIIHPDGTTELLSPPAYPSALVYDTAADRVVVAGLSTGLVSIIKPVATVAPISILTPADGSTVEPGFTVTGTGEYSSGVVITNDKTPGSSGFDIVNTDGTWAVDINDIFGPGTHTLTFTQEADGSVATLTFTIAAAPVITPVTITGPAMGSTVGLRPTLTGAGTPDAIITITDGTTTLGTATVGTTGTWTFTPTTDLPTGAHTFTATQDVDSSTATVAVTVATGTTTPDPTTPPTPGDGKLSTTGADATPMLLIGGLLAAAGITATIIGRRKRNQTA